MYHLNGENKIQSQRLSQNIVLCDDDQIRIIWKIPQQVDITEYKYVAYVMLMKNNFIYNSVGVMTIRFRQSEKYIGLEWRYQNTDVITEYTPYNRLSGQQMLSGTQIISTSHGMTVRNFFDVFLPFYLLFGF